MTVVGDAYPYQIKPDELYGILQPQFQARAEPNFAWKSCVSALMGLPALRAAWPMSSVGPTATDQVKDVTGGGYHLINNNTVDFGYDSLIPYAKFVAASSQYLSRADGGAGQWADITGGETFIVSGQEGLTLGGWFYFDALGTIMNVMGKYDVAPDNSYYIQKRAANDVQFWASGASVQSTNTPLTTTWTCIVGRWQPDPGGGAGLIEIFVNGTWTSNTHAVAALTDGGAAFTIGVLDTLANYLDGRASLCLLSACFMSRSIVQQYYHQTRAMFGV